MRVHGEIPGRTFLGEVHPVGAPTKTLISDTGCLIGSIQLLRISYFLVIEIKMIKFSCRYNIHTYSSLEGSGHISPYIHIPVFILGYLSVNKGLGYLSRLFAT